MSDYEAIRETVFHYCEGYREKDRARLERAFAPNVAVMFGCTRNEHGRPEIWSAPIADSIDRWVAPEYTPFEFAEGRMLAVDIFSDVGATVLFDFGGKFLESYQLAKAGGQWRIVSKFIVDPDRASA
ncbi:MAG TPA: nuclear transport factor 2 family protein [Trueperaceae bacterium]